MKTLDDDYWHLQCEVKYVKKRGPVFESVPCDNSYHSVFAMNYNDEFCPVCHNTGWTKKELPYPKKPTIPENLLSHLTRHYNQWCEENSISDINLNI